MSPSLSAPWALTGMGALLRVRGVSPGDRLSGSCPHFKDFTLFLGRAVCLPGSPLEITLVYGNNLEEAQGSLAPGFC
jgi:hypothetical protein